MMSSTPATALIKTNRKTEMRCIQTCTPLGLGCAADASGGSRSAVRDSAGGVDFGSLPGGLEKGVGSVIGGSAKRPHGDHCCLHWTPGGENWGQKPSGYSTTSGP